MKFSAGVVAAIAAPMAALAFVQPSVHSRASLDQAFLWKSSSRHFLNPQQERSKALTSLKMAFNLKEGQISNMFEGPAPLVKERDACGVGFIANTSTGGKDFLILIF
jgi:glutamate synthase (ferredoxin)